MSSAINRFTQFDNHTIIYLWFTVSLAQIILILLLLFESPFRNPLIVRLDELKRGRAQLVVKSIGATVFTVMMYNIYSVLDIRCRSVGAVKSPNHVIIAYRMLEAYLMGFSLMLLVVIDGVHRYIKEVIMVKESIRAANKEKRAYEDCMKKTADEADVIRKDISRLKKEITNLESEFSMKEKAVKLERADSSALKDKLEGLFEDYFRLLAYNKDLNDQLQRVNERLASSDGKKSAFFSWDRWGL